MISAVRRRDVATAFVFLFAATCARPGDIGPRPKEFAPSEQLLADKETDFAAIVRVRNVETRWVILPEDGDHVPLLLVDCELEEILSGGKSWAVGTVQKVVQADYSDLLFDPIAPPAIEGRRYVLWALENRGEVGDVWPAPWIAHPQGFLLIRGRGSPFVYWNAKSYELSAVRKAVRTGGRIPLDQISDPVRRLKVAEARIERKDLGDEKAFIRGLLLNVTDPERQSKNRDRQPTGNVSSDIFGMSAGEAQSHAIWYNSLACLRDLGRDEKRRKAVIAALAPIAQTARARVRLAAALALAELGSTAGRDALIQGFATDSGEVSSDPPDQMTFPGRYRFDDSSVTACAFALARLGDQRGLGHPDLKVRLAAAEALLDDPPPAVRTALTRSLAELETRVVALESSGELRKPRAPGDLTNRYPEEWVRTRKLLARLGDDESLRRLVDAYLVDSTTYPPERPSLVPVQQPTTWSRGPSLAQAVIESDASRDRLAERLRRLFEKDPRRDSPAFQNLRTAVESRQTDQNKAGERKPSDAEIIRLLEDSDPQKRTEGLAAAGYHQLTSLYERVTNAALHRDGEERSAAIYALGLYRQPPPDGVLRQLLVSGDLPNAFSALELATRTNPGRFARESMGVLRKWSKSSQGQPTDRAGRDTATYLPRILCRLARGPIPPALLEGLRDPDPAVRRVVIAALELSGNPDAVRSLEPLSRHPDPATREAAQTALRSLGSPGN